MLISLRKWYKYRKYYQRQATMMMNSMPIVSKFKLRNWPSTSNNMLWCSVLFITTNKMTNWIQCQPNYNGYISVSKSECKQFLWNKALFYKMKTQDTSLVSTIDVFSCAWLHCNLQVQFGNCSLRVQYMAGPKVTLCQLDEDYLLNFDMAVLANCYQFER